jgi:hypothetical protein
MNGVVACDDDIARSRRQAGGSARGGSVTLTRGGLFAVAMIAAACGSGGGTTTASPPAPSGTVVAIAVGSTGPTVFLGTPETFTAVATLSTGATENLAVGAWSSSAPSIAIVETGTGKVTSVANGEVTVSVDYQGVRGSKTVRVVPNYGGNWFGMYVVTSCTQTDGFSDTNVCSGFPVGQTFQYGLQFTQTADVVSGRTTIGLLQTTDFTASIALDGTMSFTATVFVGTLKIDVLWNLASTQPGIITGSLAQNW